MIWIFPNHTILRTRIYDNQRRFLISLRFIRNDILSIRHRQGGEGDLLSKSPSPPCLPPPKKITGHPERSEGSPRVNTEHT